MEILKLAKRKNEYDEYVIRSYVNGKFNEERSYYTDDWEDAVNTLKMEAKRQGLTVKQQGTGFIADAIVEDEFVNGSLAEWDPTTLIKRMKETRNGSMHTVRKDKKGNLHIIHLDAWGTTDKAEVWVDVIVETPQGKQDRVLMKKTDSWEAALQVMQDYKKKHINDSKLESIANVVKAYKATKDAILNDKSLLDELATLAKEAEALGRISSASNEAVRNFITHCTNSYSYIKSNLDGFAKEMVKYLDKDNNFKEGSEKFAERYWGHSIGDTTSFMNAFSTVAGKLDTISDYKNRFGQLSAIADKMAKMYSDAFSYFKKYASKLNQMK